MSYREQLICLITLAILISGHDPATVTKWEDMDCSIHIYASHYYKVRHTQWRNSMTNTMNDFVRANPIFHGGSKKAIIKGQTLSLVQP